LKLPSLHDKILLLDLIGMDGGFQMDKETKKWLAIMSIILAAGAILLLLLFGGRITNINIPGRFGINIG